MQLLKEIYNPLSDTHLVMYHDDEKGYGVARRVRSFYKSRLGLQWFYTNQQAEESFKTRLKKEEGMSLLGLQWRACAAQGISFYNLSSGYETEPLKKGERDAQQHRLYQAEYDLFKRRPDVFLSLGQAKDLCRAISSDYNIKTPEIFLRGRQSWIDRLLMGTEAAATYNIPYNAVSYYGAQNVTEQITCHEMGHAITGKYFPKSTWHGPCFAAVSTQLYVRYLGIDANRIVNRYNYDELYGPSHISKQAIFALNRMMPDVQESLAPALR